MLPRETSKAPRKGAHPKAQLTWCKANNRPELPTAQELRPRDGRGRERTTLGARAAAGSPTEAGVVSGGEAAAAEADLAAERGRHD